MSTVEDSGGTVLSMSDRKTDVDEKNVHKASSEIAGFDVPSRTALTGLRIANILTNLTCGSIVNSFATGLLTVGIAKIADDLSMSPSLVFWPQSVYALSCGCSLITLGAIADVVGSKKVYLSGCALLAAFNVGCGRSQTAAQLIAFRACQGIATAMCMPTGISIITQTLAASKDHNRQQTSQDLKKHAKSKALRSIGLALQGLGLPLGFSLGLLLGGFFADSSLTWRFGFYLNAGINAVVVLHGLPFLPTDRNNSFAIKVLSSRIDIVGAGLSVAILGSLLTALAFIAADPGNIGQAHVIALLCVAAVLAPFFPLWTLYRDRRGKVVLLPTHLWSNKEFPAICIMVFLSWGVVQSLEVFMSLFYQDVQGLSAQQASLRYIPDVVLGIITNLTTGLIVTKVNVYAFALCGCLLSCPAPLIMALIHPDWPYWWAAFWAVLLSPVAVDVLYTVAAIVITSSFPADRQAMGGAVFSTSSQLGVSIGLALFAVISSAVSDHVGHNDSERQSPNVLMEGYRAAFWTMFALLLLSLTIGIVYLQKVGHLVGGRG